MHTVKERSVELQCDLCHICSEIGSAKFREASSQVTGVKTTALITMVQPAC